MKDISELMLDRLLEMQKRVIELEQKLAVVQEREAARDNPHVDQAEQHAQAAEAVAETESLPDIPEGFIRHDGDGCPVPPYTKAIVMWGKGNFSAAHFACGFYWGKNPNIDHCIIAYKVIEE